MPDTTPQETLDTNASELRLNRLEAAWRDWRPGGAAPRWQDHLPADDESCSPDRIFYLVRKDIECRIKAGVPALLAERYFEHPRLQREDARLNSERQVELIRWEYQQRWKQRDPAHRSEYEAAFPQHVAALGEMRPSSHCPRCQKIIVLEETMQTVSCPDCGNDWAIPESVPPFVAETPPALAAWTELDLRRYELSETLGTGGMGEVYRCCDPALGRDLAIKVMKAGLHGHAEIEQRFLREARITGSLQHPGIVPIHNLGRLSDGRLHYTMRLVRGQTFAAILNDEAGKAERLPYLLSIFEKICQAVAYAHSKRVIHRDLKPHNVMVGRFGEVQVMDWGLAKLLTTAEESASPPNASEDGGTLIHTESADTPLEMTRVGSGMGTPAYMPPEQALGKWETVDERADVFALGSILCQILTGKPTYTGKNPYEVERRAKYADLAETWGRLEQCGADAALTTLCRECLDPDWEKRPNNAGVVAERVAAYRAEVQERLRQAEVERAEAQAKAREERKKRRWVIAFLLVLTTGTVLSTWQAFRATLAEGKARASEGMALAESNAKEIALVQAKAAAEEERKAKDLAEKRLGEVAKANEVSASIFRDLDPQAEEKGGLGLREQLSQRLKRAANQLDEAAFGDEVAVARLQAALGKSLLHLGEAKQAVELLTKAGLTLEKRLGTDHPDTLASRHDLAAAYHDAGRLTDAVRLFKQTAKQREAKLGADHPDTLASRSSLAEAYQSAGRTDEAIRLSEQCLPQMEQKLGFDHPSTSACRNNLAGEYLKAGRIAEAIQLLEPTLKQIESKFGGNHLDALICRNNLAEAYRAAGRIADTTHLSEQSLQVLEGKLGLGHPYTCTCRNNLATAYLSAGRIGDAIRLCEQNLKLSEARHGPDHPHTLSARNNLALVYLSAGRTAEAVNLHEKTLKQMEVKLGSDHPLTLTSRSNLAEAYLTAGRTNEAIRLYVQTLQESEAKLGAEHPDLLTTRGNLASAYLVAGRTGEAIDLFERIVKESEAKLGADHPDTLQLRNNLAEAYRSDGRTAKAIHLHRENLKQRELKLGPDHPDTLLSQNNLALAYQDAGRNPDALRLLEQTLKQMEAKLGPGHPHTLTCRNNLASQYRSAGRIKEAIPLLEEVLKQMEAKVGSEHPNTLACRANLATAYVFAGRTADAIRLQGENLKQMETQLGPDHPYTLATRNDLANAFIDAGRTEDAIRLHKQNLKLREAKLGSDHPGTLQSRNNLASAYRAAGRLADAIPLQEQTVKQREAKLGPDHPSTLISRDNLALAYLDVGRTADAIRLHEQTLKQMKTKLGPDHPDTLLAMANLGRAYREAGRHKEAISLLEESLERGRKRAGGFPALLARIPVLLAETYERAGQPAKAEAVYRDALEQARRQFGSADPRTAGQMATLGLNLLQQRKYTDAEPMLRDCLKIREDKQPDFWATFNAQSLLGAALLGQKKYAEAEPLLLQGYEGMKARQAKIPPQAQVRVTEALERLVQLYESMNQKNKADSWRKKLEETKAAQKKAKP